MVSHRGSGSTFGTMGASTRENSNKDSEVEMAIGFLQMENKNIKEGTWWIKKMVTVSIPGLIKFFCTKEISKTISGKATDSCLKMDNRNIRESGWQEKLNSNRHRKTWMMFQQEKTQF